MVNPQQELAKREVPKCSPALLPTKKEETYYSGSMWFTQATLFMLALT